MALLRAALRIAAIASITVALLPFQWLALRLDHSAARTIPVRYHRIVCRILGVRLIERGRPPTDAPALILANHISWLDVVAIGALAPLSFIAKAEIAGWPVFGLLARLQRSVFVDRTRRRATTEVNTTIVGRLAAGDAIVLFAEGTTGDGTRVLPFRSALVGAARDALAAGSVPRLELKPLSIAYVARNGLPLGRAGRSTVAWFGDMELMPNLLSIMNGAPLDIVVDWGEPVRFDGDRKSATRKAEARVREGLNKALLNR